MVLRKQIIFFTKYIHVHVWPKNKFNLVYIHNSLKMFPLLEISWDKKRSPAEKESQQRSR